MIDYTIYYKTSYSSSSNWAAENYWDVLISGFNNSDRILTVFDITNSAEKHWLVFPDYCYKREKYPSSGEVFDSPGANSEDDFIRKYFQEFGHRIVNKKICIDITGFTRAHLLFLIKYLSVKGIRQFEALYSVPQQYIEKEETKFFDENVQEVRQVAGYEGNHTTHTSNDVLVIGVGYDNQLISNVAQYKDKTKKIQIFGLPSLQADMYQESVLRANLAAEDVGVGVGDHPQNFFAPAYDPFVTADVLREVISGLNSKKAVTNLYLAPLSTKPQALGFALYYLTEWQDKAASIILPVCGKQVPDPSVGISKIWKYTIELPS
jgi:hypothetical protein